MKDLDCLVEDVINEMNLAGKLAGAVMLGAAKLDKNTSSYKENTPVERSSGIRFAKPIQDKTAERFLKLLVTAAYNDIKTSNPRLNSALKYVKTRFVKASASINEEEYNDDKKVDDEGMGSYIDRNNKLSGACFRYVEKNSDYSTGEGLAFEVLCYMIFEGTTFAPLNDPTIDLVKGSMGIQCKWCGQRDKDHNEKFGGIEKKDFNKFDPYKIASGNFKKSTLYTPSEEGKNILLDLVDGYNNRWKNKEERKEYLKKYNSMVNIDYENQLILNKGYFAKKENFSKEVDITSEINEALKEAENQLESALKDGLKLKSEKDWMKLGHNMSTDGQKKEDYKLMTQRKEKADTSELMKFLESIRNYNGPLLDKTGNQIGGEIKKAMGKDTLKLIDGSTASISLGGSSATRTSTVTLRQYISEVVKKYDIHTFGTKKGQGVSLEDFDRGLKGLPPLAKKDTKAVKKIASIETYFNY